MDQQASDALGLLCACGGLVVGLAGLAFVIWSLIHAVRNPALTNNERIIWIVVIVVGGACGWSST